MYRVVTRCIDQQGRWINERGPWLISVKDAEYWSGTLKAMGYFVTVEPMQGHVSSAQGDDELRDALSSMA